MDEVPTALALIGAMMLMDLRGASPARLLKVSVMALPLRRVLWAEAETHHGWGWTRTVTLLRLGQTTVLPLHEQAVIRLVQAVLRWQPRDVVVELVFSAVRREWRRVTFTQGRDAAGTG